MVCRLTWHARPDTRYDPVSDSSASGFQQFGHRIQNVHAPCQQTRIPHPTDPDTRPGTGATGSDRARFYIPSQGSLKNRPSLERRDRHGLITARQHHDPYVAVHFHRCDVCDCAKCEIQSRRLRDGGRVYSHRGDVGTTGGGRLQRRAVGFGRLPARSEHTDAVR